MTVATADLKSAAKSKERGTWAIALIRFRRNPMAVIALVFILLQVVVAFAAPLISPYDPLAMDLQHCWALPGGAHILGTDDLGRDLLSRLIWGSRASLAVGVLSQIVNVAIGLPLGALAGLLGGWVDFVLQRVIDVLSALPMIFVYILMMAVLGSGLGNLLIAMAITGWVGYARLARGQVLSVKSTDYVRASQAMGGNSGHILMTHLVRNAVSPIIISMAMGVPSAIFGEAGISYLGMGITPPTPSWGQMIGAYQGYIVTAWHLTLFPSVLLSLTMLAWMFLGDGVRDALDPSMRV